MSYNCLKVQEQIALVKFPGFSPEKVIQNIKEGRTVVTNGPMLDFIVQNENGEFSRIGGTITGKKLTVNFRLVSSHEFGPLRKLCLYFGDIKSHKEELIYNIHFDKNNFRLRGAIDFEAHEGPCYLRGELFSGSAEETHFCLTNPIWLTKTS